MKIDYEARKFLVVDDFAGFRSMLRGMLQMLGAKHIDDASNAARAVEKIAKNNYDVILCDYNLGSGQDGQGVLEEAKFRGLVGYTTVFVMITAENTMKMVMGAVEYKPDDYLTKPFNKGLLKKRLDNIISKKSDLGKILRAADRGEYKKAVINCDKEMVEHPKMALEIAKIKGEVCIRADQYNLAEQVYEKVLSIKPLVWARLGMGKVKYYKGEYDNAIEILQVLVNENKLLVEAYDLLSMALNKRGDSESAQTVLMNAVELSPKAILRHKQLGRLAYDNGDLVASETALKSAVKLGKTSYLRNPKDHFALSKVLLEQKKADEALQLIAETRKNFKKDENVQLETRILEAKAFQAKGSDDLAKRLFQDACKDFTSGAQEIPAHIVEDMVDICSEFGENEMADALKEALESGDETINLSTNDALANFEFLRMNMQGIECYGNDDLPQAIELFEKAAQKMPKHISSNMNAAQALLENMKEQGKKNKVVLKRVRKYLDRSKKVDSSNEKYQKLEIMYAQVVG
ncbi:MAG: response regulator [Methylococcales bacterium]|mgnify:CR=1 FL=1|jgi:CheY-like chemotaxis protein|nr:response regulator [Methylococcales bacterium]MBT7443556.1 response regulator [Methylococcales bacterium]